MENIHRPVMVEEVLDILNPHNNGIYVDATVGDGGHTAEIFKCARGGISVVAIDRDVEAIERAKSRLSEYLENIVFFNVNFASIDEVVTTPVDGILIDLGVSTHQLMSPERGFSFEKEGPLDMRMGSDSRRDVDELVNYAKEGEISRILYEYGGERFSRRIARAIVENRPIKTTLELADIVSGCYPEGFRRIHPATRTFQALRIWVNEELENLRIVLVKSSGLLKMGGCLIVISYHSLEHGIVRGEFKKLVNRGFIWESRGLRPSRREVLENRRSRSANLNAIRRKC